MAARAMWKGVIKFGDVEVPVKLYSAVSSQASLHFRLLHAKDNAPVEQRMVNPRTGREVQYEDVKRAFQTEDGELIIIEPEELEELEPEASRDIEVLRFVGDDVITHPWYDRPYYLGPDDSDAAYFSLVSALKKKKRTGVARWVMRKKEYVGALRVEGDYLMLVTLLHAGSVVPASKLPAPGGRALDRKELQMAKQLVGALEDELDISAFRDEYRDRVLELVEAKREGKVIEFPEARRRETDDSLANMLKASLKGAKGGRKKAASG